MAREWFTVAEVKAAAVPTLSPEYIDFIVTDFHELKAAGKARLRRQTYNKKASCVEMLFHVSLFMPAEQLRLQRTLCEGIFGRILKLGIHRKVFDPREHYQPRYVRRAPRQSGKTAA